MMVGLMKPQVPTDQILTRNVVVGCNFIQLSLSLVSASGYGKLSFNVSAVQAGPDLTVKNLLIRVQLDQKMM